MLTKVFMMTGGVARCCVCVSLLLALSPAARAQDKTGDAAAKKGESVTGAKPSKQPTGGVRDGREGRAAIAEEVAKKREELSESEKLFLAPPPEDLEAYADFLKLPRTGLVRLLPRETFEGKLAINGGGAYYSFTRLVHDYGHGADIELYNDAFSTGFAGVNFGLLVDLGDAPLEGVTRETYGVRPLAEYKPPTAEPKAREEKRRAAEGFQTEGFTYKRKLPVRVDNTYALRSIDYDRTDVLVAFRVVRKDSDGSVVLLWKLLKKYSKPILERAAVPGS